MSNCAGGSSLLLILMLAHQVFDHEFASQQTARIVRDLSQPLFLGELLFALGFVCFCVDRLHRLVGAGLSRLCRSVRGLLPVLPRLGLVVGFPSLRFSRGLFLGLGRLGIMPGFLCPVSCPVLPLSGLLLVCCFFLLLCLRRAAAVACRCRIVATLLQRSRLLARLAPRGSCRRLAGSEVCSGPVAGARLAWCSAPYSVHRSVSEFAACRSVVGLMYFSAPMISERSASGRSMTAAAEIGRASCRERVCQYV